MYKRNEKKLSWIISIGIHLVLAAVLFLITVSAESEPDEFVTVGFGTYGHVSKPGTKEKKINKTKSVSKPPRTKKEETKKKEKPKLKKVELPKAAEKADVSIIKEKKRGSKNKAEASVKSISTKKTKAKKGNEKTGSDEGNTGFKIDFGGRGIRKIYSYTLPKYPSGVSKEIDIKLRFTILPDGTVAKVFPLIKADARLESASISSLRQWRFEPIPKELKQIEQKAVIVFPYRLR